GGRIWNAAAPGPVQLGYKWVSNATGNTFPGANRVSLPSDVQPGQTISMQIPVTAPVYPTNYTMSLDLYKQNEFAFADKGIADNDTNTGVSVDFKSAYTFNSVPQFTAGQTTTVPVTIRNIGNGTFPTTNSFPINLAYHWTSASGANGVWDGARSPRGGPRRSTDAGPGDACVPECGRHISPALGPRAGRRLVVLGQGCPHAGADGLGHSVRGPVLRRIARRRPDAGDHEREDDDRGA